MNDLDQETLSILKMMAESMDIEIIKSMTLDPIVYCDEPKCCENYVKFLDALADGDWESAHKYRQIGIAYGEHLS